VKLEPISISIVEGMTDDPRRESVPHITGTLEFYFWNGKEWEQQVLNSGHEFRDYDTGKALPTEKIVEMKDLVTNNIKRVIWGCFHNLMEVGEIEIEGTTHQILAVARYPIIVKEVSG
jgi:hypothetical protein